MLDTITTYRRLATITPAGDTLGLDQRDPTGWALAQAELAAQARPFAELVADVDAYFAGQLAEALAGPEAAEAIVQARRIVAEHLAKATMRLALSAAAGAQVDFVRADVDALRALAAAALQRAADQRFAGVVAPLFAKPSR